MNSKGMYLDLTISMLYMIGWYQYFGRYHKGGLQNGVYGVEQTRYRD
jgi:hypothetical protein